MVITATRKKKANIWDLDDDVYRGYVEDEISGNWADDTWVADELARCFSFDDYSNPNRGYLYWARRHWFLVNKDGKVALFRPNYPQWHYLTSRFSENVLLKSRKVGQSTVVDSMFYWRARQRAHQRMSILAHTREAAAELWSRVLFGHQMIKERRPFLHAPTKHSSRRELEWTDNFSKLLVTTAGGKGVGRSADVDGLHLSEAAHYDDLPGVLAAIGEAVRPGCWIDIESTPAGYNAFRDEYLRAKSGRSNRAAIFTPWFHDPGNIRQPPSDMELTDEEAKLMRVYDLSMPQIAFRRQKDVDLGPLARQEQAEDDETCFLLGGTPLFDGLKIREIMKHVEETFTPLTDFSDAPFEAGEKDAFTIWDLPKPHHSYVIGADVSEGIPGMAYSVACVLDITGGGCEQVAEWRGHINPFLFGNMILGPLGFWYNKSLVAPERNNHGHSSIAGLRECQYPRIYKHRSNMKSRQGKIIAPKYGIHNNSETRPQLLAALRRMLHNRDFKVKSLRLLHECISMQAEEAMHDADKEGTEFRDCVFAAAIALFIRKRSLPIVI